MGRKIGDAAKGSGGKADATQAARLHECLKAVRSALRHRHGGRVATYIPQLSLADPGRFGLAACTPEGTLAEEGEAAVEFTLQSISKPFVYGLALQRFGEEAVRSRVGVEPTGAAFDEIIELEPGSRRPHNPMVNAGAISVTAMFCALPEPDRMRVLMDLFQGLAGRGLSGVDEATYRSEAGAGDRNRAMSYLMRHAGAIPEDPVQALDLYFRQCSIRVTARDLAVMGATLASGGSNPLTGERIFRPGVARNVLTIMATCGLYDRSGTFLFESGMPAKSGVAGGLLAVSPGRIGLAAYSPPLDAKGNSVRGVAAVARVSRRLGLHLFRPERRSRSVSSSGLLPSEALLRELMEEVRPIRSGKPAAYLPAPESPDLMGAVLWSVDGTEIRIGDWEKELSLQASINPFVYAAVRQERGRAQVHRRVGCEPSGNPYHAIHLDREKRRPFNPLGNAGAITICSMVPGGSGEARFDHLSKVLESWFGGPLAVDSDVLRAERENGDRNRGIASLLRHVGLLQETEPALDLYFRSCSVKVSCRQLARASAVLASGGLGPGSRGRLLGARTVRDTLSLMYSCGFHDQSGRFAFEAGIPAKTGISGFIAAVVPGRFGAAVYSPRVNAQGTSIRGAALLTALSRRMALGLFDRLPSVVTEPD